MENMRVTSTAQRSLISDKQTTKYQLILTFASVTQCHNILSINKSQVRKI